jgi:exonuclease III
MSNHNRSWKILSWNVRGMNDNRKWSAIRNTIEESCCVAFCLQETKRSVILSNFLKNICQEYITSLFYTLQMGLLGASYCLEWYPF